MQYTVWNLFVIEKKNMACGVHTALFQIERGEGAYGVDCIM